MSIFCEAAVASGSASAGNARPAGDTNWPIACSHTTFGTADKELDLSGAHLSYGDFTSDTFIGWHA